MPKVEQKNNIFFGGLNSSRFTILVSTIWFSGMPDLVVRSKITLTIALQIKSKMSYVGPKSNNINWYHFHYIVEADS